MKKITKKVLALALSAVFLAGGTTKAYADELTDPYIKDIRNGNILPPQYEIKDDDGDGIDDDLGIRRDSPSVDKWIESVESQDKGCINGAIKLDKEKKFVKIKKVDQNGEPIEDVVFMRFLNELDAKNYDAENDDLLYLNGATTDKYGIALNPLGFALDLLPPTSSYFQYLKEVKAPTGVKISEEPVIFYRDNGVRFLGEKDVTNVEIVKIGETKKTSNVNLNEYLQSLNTVYGEVLSANKTINWLVFNDNGKEKLIPKKPLKYDLTWEGLEMVGLVDGSKTVTVDGKTYKIRLMRAYNDTVDVNKGGFFSYGDRKDEGKYERGSEWNRMILPLIGIDGNEASVTSSSDYDSTPYGRFGSKTEPFVEQNMPTLANYSWWKDFGGNSDSSGNYDKHNYYGACRLMQNADKNNSNGITIRGDNVANGAASSSVGYDKNDIDDRFGWLPILELVE